MCENKRLFPCPFCGGKAKIQVNKDFKAEIANATVVCEMCKASSQTFSTEDGAIEAWNHRIIDEKVSELLADIEEICKNQRESHVDDSVCGLCGYDADHGLDGYANECPGFEKDDCFRLRESYKRKFLEGTSDEEN